MRTAAGVSTLEVRRVAVSAKTTWLFLRLIGSDGVQGIGEATLNARTEEVLAALPQAVDALAGCRHGPAAKVAAISGRIPGVVGRAIASGIEQAWLDREGRRTGRPIFALLGGRRRDIINCYANINRGTLSRRPDEFADRAVRAVNAGYRSIKLAPFDGVQPQAADASRRSRLIEAGLERIRAVIERLGSTARVQVDCHSRFETGEVIDLLQQLAGVGISWLEEPVRETADTLSVLADVRKMAQSRRVLLAGAENAAALHELLPFLMAGAYDVVMPDIVLSGGPLEVVRMGHLSAALRASVSLHNPCGPVMDAHSAHVAIALPQLHSLERQFEETPLFDTLVRREHHLENGNLAVSDAPGLGLDLRLEHPGLDCVATHEAAI